MDQIIIVDGVEYQFPEGFTDAQIHDALTQNGVIKSPSPTMDGLRKGSVAARVLTTNPTEPGGLIDTLGEITGHSALTKAVELLKTGDLKAGVPMLMEGLAPTLGGVGYTNQVTRTGGDAISQAKAAYDTGDYSKALQHLVAAVPILGPVLEGGVEANTGAQQAVRDKAAGKPVDWSPIKRGGAEAAGPFIDAAVTKGASEIPVAKVVKVVKPYAQALKDPAMLKPAATLAVGAGVGAGLGAYWGSGATEVAGALLGSNPIHNLPPLFNAIAESIQRAKGKGPRPSAPKPSAAPNWSRLEPEAQPAAPKPRAVNIPNVPEETTPKPRSVVFPSISREATPQPRAVTIPETPLEKAPLPRSVTIPEVPVDMPPQPKAVTFPDQTPEVDAEQPTRSNPALKPKKVVFPSVKRAAVTAEAEPVDSEGQTTDFTPAGEPTTPASVNPSVSRHWSQNIAEEAKAGSTAVDEKLADYVTHPDRGMTVEQIRALDKPGYIEIRKKNGITNVPRDAHIQARIGELADAVEKRGGKPSEAGTMGEYPEITVTQTKDVMRQLSEGKPDANGKIKARLDDNGRVMMWEKDADGVVRQLR